MNNHSKVMQEHGKSFFWASWFLDKNTANKLFAVYAFCRRLDDLVDTSNRNSEAKEEIAKEYASSSIAIVSSLYEGFGYPVIEAMSCEIPLIATNTASIPELVGEFANLVTPKSENELSQSIKIFLIIIKNLKKLQKVADSI